MTKRAPQEKLSIPTRKPRPKGDMFANLRKPHEVETLPDEDLIPTKPHTVALPASSNLSPVESTSLVESTDLACLKTSLVESTSHVDSTGHIDLWASVPELHGGYVKLFNVIIDFIYPQLSPAEQAIYTHLYRLSWGHRKGMCFIGLPKLAARAGMSVSPAQKAIARLVERGLIEKATLVFGRGKEQGTEFRLPLPTRLVDLTSLVESTRLVKSTYIKDNTLKDTHNTGGVRVSSRFTLEECRKYVDSQPREGIRNAQGLATHLYRSGEADELIATFMANTETPSKVDASLCPDCLGSGWWYPAGKDRGAAKCKHKRINATS